MSSQSNVIFAALAVAFVIFITQRGSLRTYMGFLLGNVAAPAPTQSASNSSVATVADIGANVLPIILG